jgi:hypothetical protein
MVYKLLMATLIMFFVSGEDENQVCKKNISEEDIVEGDIDWSLNSLKQDDLELIKILKDKYVNRPSKKPYNLVQGGSTKSLGGQFGQAFFLDEHYFR